MRIRSIFFLSVSSAALNACGLGADSVPKNDIAQAELNSPAGGTIDSAQRFASTLGAIDQFEIQSSKLAEIKATSPAIKAFARSMIAAHTSSTSKLKLAVATKTPPITVSRSMTADQQRTLADLRRKSGNDFDRAYREAQVAVHEAALTSLHDYAASGNDTQLQLLAHRLIPTVSAHLRRARELK